MGERRGDGAYIGGICVYECVLFVDAGGDECVWTIFPHSDPIRESLERNTFSTSFIILSSQLSSVYSHLHACADKHTHAVISALSKPRTHSGLTLICKACH